MDLGIQAIVDVDAYLCAQSIFGEIRLLTKVSILCADTLIQIQHRIVDMTQRLRYLASVGIGCLLYWHGSVSLGSLDSSPRGDKAGHQVAAVEYYENALYRFNRQDIEGSIIQLMNVLQVAPNHLPARVLLGRAYLLSDKPNLAEQEFLMALGLGADKDLVDVELARAYLEQGKIDVLLKRLIPATHGKEAAAQLALIHGDVYMRKGDLSNALMSFEHAERFGADAGLVLVGKAQVHLANKEIAKAERLLDDALSISHINVRAWYLKGKIANAKGDSQATRSAVDKVLALDPKHVPALLLSASVHNDLNEFDAALGNLEEVLRYSPMEPTAHYLKWSVYTRRNEEKLAKKALDQAARVLEAIAVDALGADPQTLLLAGMVAAEQGKSERAVKLLEKYINEFHDNAGARLRLAALLLNLGDASRALDFLSPLLGQVDVDPAVLALAGSAYLMQDDTFQGVRRLEEAREADPGNASTGIQLAKAYLKMNREDSAVTILQQLYRDGRLDVASQLLLGSLYMGRGAYEETVTLAGQLTKQEPGNLSALNLLGSAYVESGAMTKARLMLQRALSLDPGHLQTQLNLALLDIREGRAEKAVEIYDAILKKDANQIDALSGYAVLEQSRNDLQAAIRWREKIRSFHPNAVREIILLVKNYIRVGLPDKALNVAMELYAKNSDNLEAGLGLAEAEIASGQDKQAMITLRTLSTKAGYNSRFLYRIAKYQQRLGARSSALWSLSKAVDEEPGFLRARMDMAHLQMLMGKLDDALRTAHQLQVDFPSSAVGFAIEGDVYLARKEPALAAAAFEQALSLQPEGKLLAKLYKAKAYAGNANEGIELLIAWLADHPDDIEVLKTLASARIRRNEVEEAIMICERIREHLPADPGNLNSLAMLYQMKGDRRALELAELAYQAAPENPYINDSLGWILVENGQPTRGLQYLREAQTRNSRLAVIRYHIAVALHKLERNREALTELAALLNNDQKFPERAAAEALRDRLQKQP